MLHILTKILIYKNSFNVLHCGKKFVIIQFLSKVSIDYFLGDHIINLMNSQMREWNTFVKSMKGYLKTHQQLLKKKKSIKIIFFFFENPYPFLNIQSLLFNDIRFNLILFSVFEIVLFFF